jgi:hypothetical protein
MIYVALTNLERELHLHLRERNLPILVVLQGHTSSTVYSSPENYFLATPTTDNGHYSKEVVVLKFKGLKFTEQCK